MYETDSTVKNADAEYLQTLKEKRNKNLKDSVSAQLALGFRFEHGITVAENCETSVAYIEQPARLSVDYVSRTHGLDTLERLKLNLIGPFVIPEGSM